MQESNRKSLLLRMPVLPLRGMMVFPHMVLHFDVGRPKSVAALEKAMTVSYTHLTLPTT